MNINRIRINWKALERVALALGVLLSIYAIYEIASRWFEDDKHNPDFFGIWEMRYSYFSQSGSHEINGTTEYFKNGNYNFVGKMILNEISHETTITHNVQLSGHCETDDDNLLTSVIDVKSVLVPDQTFSKKMSHYELLSNSSKLSLSSLIAKGTTELFGIKSISDESIILTSIDPNGSKFDIQMMRKYERYRY